MIINYLVFNPLAVISLASKQASCSSNPKTIQSTALHHHLIPLLFALKPKNQKSKNPKSNPNPILYPRKTIFLSQKKTILPKAYRQ
jgi:hypothetical protein